MFCLILHNVMGKKEIDGVAVMIKTKKWIKYKFFKHLSFYNTFNTSLAYSTDLLI
jgi:hypothetical protein